MVTVKGLCMRAKSLQSCLTLCNHIDCSPPGSSVHRVLQSRIWEWVAISFSKRFVGQINLGNIGFHKTKQVSLVKGFSDFNKLIYIPKEETTNLLNLRALLCGAFCRTGVLHFGNLQSFPFFLFSLVPWFPYL